MGKIRALE